MVRLDSSARTHEGPKPSDLLRRFISVDASPKYLSIYGFRDWKGMVEGKRSQEMAMVRADTQNRWKAQLGTTGERSWCEVEKNFNEETDGIADLPTLFLSHDQANQESEKILREEFIEKVCDISAVKNCTLYTARIREPDSLPAKILPCQFEKKSFIKARHVASKCFSKISPRKDLYRHFEYVLYAPWTSLVRH